ncbi:MAG: lamin tail domain-containing protein [Verrucomicrobia bacterium]|nr:lamin tail domain-containing protein [Verrucomicrobiota bacterium]
MKHHSKVSSRSVVSTIGLLVAVLMAASAGQLFAGALFLDGNGSYVSFPGAGIPSGGQSFTIEAWINPTTIPTGGADGGQITFWGNQSANQANGFRLRGATGTRHFFWGNDHDADFGIDILPDTTGPSHDGWHHLALTYDGTQTVWYWNGTPIGTRATAAGVNVAAVNHRIGCRLNAEFFHGFLDEVRVWNKARSSAEIVADLSHSLLGNESNLVAYFDFEGDLVDRAGGDNNGTSLGNATIISEAGPPIQTAGPRIFSFTAATNWVMIGTPATLLWRVTNATTLFIDNGVGAVTGATGSVQVTPMVTTTYKLTASNEFGSRTALTTVNVDPGVPVAHAQSVATIKNVPRSITLTASDPNHNTLAFALVAQPQHGVLSGTPPDLLYTPAVDFVGNDFFTFKVNDGTNDSAPGTVSIRVDADPTPPSAIILSTLTIDAAATPGGFLAALRTIDANPLDTHTYALVAGAGDTDNGLFAVNSNLLLAGAAYSVQPGVQYSIRLRATDSATLPYEQVVLLTAVTIERNIVINELHYNSPQNTIREEFIELFNPLSVAVALSNWRLSGGIDFPFPAGTTLAPGAFLLVAQDPVTILSRYGVNALGPWTGQLSNEGEEVTLRDATDNAVDAVDFRVGFPWPIASDGDGPSMELISPSLDNNLGSSWAAPLNPAQPSPGRTNQVFQYNAAPNIRQVNHAPKQPASTNAVTITVKVTDPEGVASVVLAYQIVSPGNFIPSFLALTAAQLNTLNANPTLTNQFNPAFEAATNWTSVAMHDDGLNGDEVPNDSIYTVVLPPQANRVLVRYRITVTDTFGAARRAPFADDPALNFAYFVYDGIPAYQGHSETVLQSLPVYWLITRDADVNQCAGWFNTGDQLPQDVGGSRNEGRLRFNWEGAVVYDGEVYDHVTYRLRGANGRYHPGKRSFRIRFNPGQYLAAKDQDGHPFPTKWRELTTGKGQGNRGSVTYGLNEVVSYFLWNKVGVPSPSTLHFHFRVVRGAQESPADPYAGDFWGMNWAQEKYDVNFLDAHGLARGNLYKLVDNYVLGTDERRYLAPFAVTNAADFFNIENNLTGSQSRSWLEAHANYTNWYRYHAIAEAIRHYDVWPSCNKNGAWYFEPPYSANNSFFGRMWLLPYDSTDTWGPTWNGGQDVLHNGIFNDSTVTGGDAGQNLEMQRQYRNTVRELRDLLFQPDQINAVIDAFAARLYALAAADHARWSNAPSPASYRTAGTSANQSPGPGNLGGLPAYAQDMKNFMFAGGNNAWWLDRTAVGAGGWVTRLDTLATDATIPNKPTLTYVGPSSWPVDELDFQSSAFSDPQGSATFAALQYRVAEVQDPVAAAVPGVMPPLEWDATWDSGELPAFTNRVRLPAYSVVPGQLYRARVRHKDLDGNWSSWSAPVQFKAIPVDVVSVLQTNLIISEIMYRPPVLGGVDGDEFEFLELKNIGQRTLDLSGLSFSAGLNFTFTNGTFLQPGQFFLLARNPARFTEKYPGVVVNGAYSGRLDNNGETITLTHPYGSNIVSATYEDRAPWPVAPDGYGFSLVPDAGAPTGWRASSQAGGSPGANDAPSLVPHVVVNEILTGSVPPAVDAIELYNPTTNEVALGGWFLTDSAGQPTKFRISDGTVLPAGGYVVFTETNFNPTPGVGASFSLSSLGEEVYLFSGDAATNLTGYSHGFAFGGAKSGETFGRHLNSVDEEQFPPQLTPSLGTNNAGPRVGPVVIYEINYHPLADGDEFLELLNLTANAVPLFDPATPTNTWRLNGLGYTFPTNVTLAANGLMLLVRSAPEVFRAKYAVPAEVPVLGPYPGALQQNGERLELQSPDLLTTNGTPYFIVDAVRYNDKAPWPVIADGLGASLRRKTTAQYGDDPTNWIATAPSPGDLGQGGTAPSITAQPLSQAVVGGASATFTASANGDTPLFLQWGFNDTLIPGATNSTLLLTNIQRSQAGAYRLAAMNLYGSAVSDAAVLTVPFAITNQPQDLTVFPYATVAFTLGVSADPGVVFQWRFNGTDLVGATNSTLTKTGVLPADTGAYTVLVTNAGLFEMSAPALLTVLTNPIILVQPQDQAALPTSNVLFSVMATSSTPLRYQWHFNGANLPNATNRTLLLTNTSASHVGTYDVLVTDSFGSVLSGPAQFTQLIKPGVAQQPTPRTVTAYVGDTVAYTIVVSNTTTLPVGYRWRRNGSAVATNLVSSYSNTLTLANVQLAHAGAYDVAITNLAGNASPATSARCFLTVMEVLADRAVPLGSNATFNLVITNGSPSGASNTLNFSWWFQGTNRLSAGATPAFASLTITNVQASNFGPYTVVVTNAAGTYASQTATLSLAEPPVIVGQPTNQTVSAGADAAFAVTVTGSAPLGYRWWFNGTNAVPGGTASVLTLSNAQPSQAGGYQVIVSNIAGMATSQVATLTVTLAEPPRFDGIIAATSPTEPVTLNFTAQPGQTYSVLYSDTVTNTTWLVLTNIGPLGAAEPVTARDADVVGRPQRFYRIVTPAQP